MAATPKRHTHVQSPGNLDAQDEPNCLAYENISRKEKITSSTSQFNVVNQQLLVSCCLKHSRGSGLHQQLNQHIANGPIRPSAGIVSVAHDRPFPAAGTSQNGARAEASRT